MSLSPMEALCLDLKRIWINKAQYEDAERKFQIAVSLNFILHFKVHRKVSRNVFHCVGRCKSIAKMKY